MPTKRSTEPQSADIVADLLARMAAKDAADAARVRRQAAFAHGAIDGVAPWDLPDDSLWIDGISPPSFTDFVTSPEYMDFTLFPLQREFVVQSIGDEARQVFYPRALLPEWRAAWGAARPEQRRLWTMGARVESGLPDVTDDVLLVLGKGCIAGETPLTDIHSGETRSAESWARDGRPLMVASFHAGTGRIVTAPASPVYAKGVAPLVRVILGDGRAIRVTAAHRFLTPQGWRPLADLAVGDAIAVAGDRGVIATPIVALTPSRTEPFYDLTVAGAHCYFDANGILSHNSGKDTLVTLIFSYLAYVVASLADPWTYFNTGRGQKFSFVNVAASADQAQGPFFDRLTAWMKKPCFGRFAPAVLTSEVNFTRAIDGATVPSLWLELVSLHSNFNSFEGRNVLAFCADEVDGYEDAHIVRRTGGDEGRRGKADRIVGSLRSSTRFPRQSLAFQISFPRSDTGYVMPKYREVTACDATGMPLRPNVYARLETAYAVNPLMRREELQSLYDEDPEGCLMRFECIPPAVKNGFFPSRARVEAAFAPDLSLGIAVSETIESLFTGEAMIGLSIDALTVTPGRQYYGHFDAANSADSFSFVYGHPENEGAQTLTDENGVPYQIPTIVVDGILVWTPDPRRRLMVDENNAAAVIARIARATQMRKVTCDRFESTQLRQTLLRMLIPCEYTGYSNPQQVSLFKNLKAVISAGRLRIPGGYDPAFPVNARLLQELLQLQLFATSTGGKIDHPPGGAKDLADALAGFVALASGHVVGGAGFSNFRPTPAPRVVQSDEESLSPDATARSFPLASAAATSAHLHLPTRAETRRYGGNHAARLPIAFRGH